MTDLYTPEPKGVTVESWHEIEGGKGITRRAAVGVNSG